MEAKEEHKYSLLNENEIITEPHKVRNIQDNDVKDELFIKKETRNINDIENYLKHYVPPFTEISLISTLIFMLSLGYNIYFIISNVITKYYDSKDLKQPYLNRVHAFIIWFEFIVLIAGIYYTVFISLCYGKSRATITNGLIFCQTWSTFKLFYWFNPYNTLNNIRHLYQHSKNAQILTQKQWQYLASLNIYNNSDNNYQYMKRKSESIYKKYKLDFMNTIFFLIIILVSLGCLWIGILFLMVKISKLSFIDNKDFFSFSLNEYYLVIGLCNQLWGMVDDNKIRIDTLYKSVFMDIIKGEYTKYISQKVVHLDLTIKDLLWKQYGFKGLLLGLNMDWVFVFKLAFSDSLDKLKIGECKEYEYTRKPLFKSDIFEAIYITKLIPSSIKEWINEKMPPYMGKNSSNILDNIIIKLLFQDLSSRFNNFKILN